MDSFYQLAEWHKHLEANFAPKTVAMYRGAVRRFLEYTGCPFSEVTPQQVDEWIASFPFRSSARATYFMALKSCAGFYLRQGYRVDDPTAWTRVPPRESKEHPALNEDQYEAVKSAAYRRSSLRGLVVELLYYSGGRIGEVCRLRWREDIVTEGLVFRQTKGGKDRMLPWDQGGNLERILMALHTFTGEKELVVNRKMATVEGWTLAAGKDAGIPFHVTPHTFRRTMARSAMKNGADVRSVQAVLGHSKMQTTQSYLPLEEGDRKEAMAKLWQPKQGSHLRVADIEEAEVV